MVRKKKIKDLGWESDSCFICQVMEETEKQGRSPTEEELLNSFAAQKKVNEKIKK